MSADIIREQIQGIYDAGNAGFGIVPAYGMRVQAGEDSSGDNTAVARKAFMSPPFLRAYRTAVEKAADLGLKVCLYDEFWFPSGWAGGQVATQHPEALSKRLDLHTIQLAGSTRYSKLVPPGTLMAAVAMETKSLERVDLSTSIKDGWLEWAVPNGHWQIMFFMCVTDGAKGLIDYLDPSAVDAYLGLTYDKYYEVLKDHFGSTIDVAFYDEPTMHWVEGGRAWTPLFNKQFVEQYGCAPDLLYPALWYDVGPETASARCALFGLRAELFSMGYVKRMNDWCAHRGIKLTGHVDQEEIANPVGLCGDLMKTFKYQDIPAFDQVFKYGRAQQAAKVVTSAATNYDRPLVVCECYGATEGLEKNSAKELYREAIDLYSRGMNVLMPHAVWYDSDAMEFPPNVSLVDRDFGPHIKKFNAWVGRIQNVLQRGRSVADIGVLYPIDSHMAAYNFSGGGDPYLGGMDANADESAAEYLNVGEALIKDIHRDFTYVHPDVLRDQCRVVVNESGEAVLQLESESGIILQRYRVFVLPGITTIGLDALKLIKEFHDAGGIVLATKRLPSAGTVDLALSSAPESRSSTPDRRLSSAPPTLNTSLRKSSQVVDKSVQDLAEEMFSPRGSGRFVLNADASALAAVLDDALPIGDVAIHAVAADAIPVSQLTVLTDEDPPQGHVSYLHKSTEDSDLYFLGNSQDHAVVLHVLIEGNKTLTLMDLHSGSIKNVDTRIEGGGLRTTTSFEVHLGPVEAVIVSTK